MQHGLMLINPSYPGKALILIDCENMAKREYTPKNAYTFGLIGFEKFPGVSARKFPDE